MKPKPAETLRELLETSPAGDGQPAVLTLRADGSVDAVSRSDLARRVFSFSEILLKSGVRPGEPVALLGPNSVEWIVGCLGVVCAGALPVPIDCQASGRDIARILADCAALRVLTTASQARSLRAGQPTEITFTLLEDLAAGADAPEAVGGTQTLPGLLPRLHSEDAAVLFYTSGTTGTPKGVPLSHHNLLANVRALMASELGGPGDRILSPLPLHHTYPFTCGLLGSIAVGAALVLPAGVTGPELVAAIRGTGATMLLGVPRLYTALLAGIEAKAAGSKLTRKLFDGALRSTALLPRRARIRAGRLLFGRLHRQMGPSLRVLASGGARLEPEVARRLEGVGWQVFSGYGLTETSPILTFNIGSHVRHETVGWPLPGVEVRIAAPEGQDSGEVQARGPNVFSGYRNDPEATRAAFTSDGWFRTGDLGRLDDDGFLHIVGRVKEVIVLPDGKKIAPEDVEQFYAASPLIREAALLEHEGRLVALVVPDEAGVRERGAVRLGTMMRETIEVITMKLPAYQRITDYRLHDQPLPRTPLGKLQRFRLAEIYAAGRGEVRGASASAVLSEADRRLLESDLGRRAWAWLQERFADKPLALDASPQLDLGVDSLEWLTLTLEMRDRFGVALGQQAVARMLTVRDLLQELQAAPAVSAQPVAAAGAESQRRGLALRMLGIGLLAVDRALMRIVFRLRVEGLQHLPQCGPVLIAPNHASYLDSLAIAAALPWSLLRVTRWAGWTDFMFRNRRWRLLSRSTGVFPVAPDREPAAAIETAVAVLREGQVLVWFPEGRRTLTGEIGRFLPGVGLLLLESGSPAVPARISGTFEALPWHRRWPRPKRITVRFGPPMTRDELQAMGDGDSPAERVAAGLRQSVLRIGGNGDQKRMRTKPG